MSNESFQRRRPMVVSDNRMQMGPAGMIHRQQSQPSAAALQQQQQYQMPQQQQSQQGENHKAVHYSRIHCTILSAAF